MFSDLSTVCCVITACGRDSSLNKLLLLHLENRSRDNFCSRFRLVEGQIIEYKEVHRQCVFSNDELMCKIAESVDSLDLTLAGVVWHDLKKVFDEDTELQSKLFAKVFTIWRMLAMSDVAVIRHM